jgi:hypothetical protein
MQNISYIGYNNVIGGLREDYINSVVAAGGAVASGGTNIAADIAAIVASVKFFGSLWNQWTSHPAADARDFIKKAKEDISTSNPYDRLVKVIGYSKKINPQAIGINTKEWLKWYRQNARYDYKSLLPQDKIYFNEYLEEIRNKYGSDKNILPDLDASYFSVYEINYNATPVETVQNLFSNIDKNKLALYGAIGLGAILLIKNLK